MKDVSKQNKVVQIRISEDEKESFLIAASISGVSLSAWIRERLRIASIKDIEATGNKVPFLKRIKI